MTILRWLFASVALSWGFNLFGVPVTVIGEEFLIDGQHFEDEDKKTEVETTNEYLYAEEGYYSDSKPIGQYYPPKQHWWMR